MHPALSLQTHYDTKPFMMIPDVGTECNTRRAKSVTAYRHIQAQRASVCHLASARYIFCCCCFLFSPRPPKRSTLALGPGPETSENGDASCTVFSAHAAWLKRSLNLAAVKTHYSLFGLSCSFCSYPSLSSNMTLVDAGGWENKCYLCYLSLGFHQFFLLILKHTHWMYGQ